MPPSFSIFDGWAGGHEWPLLTQRRHSQPYKNLRICSANALQALPCRTRSGHVTNENAGTMVAVLMLSVIRALYVWIRLFYDPLPDKRGLDDGRSEFRGIDTQSQAVRPLKRKPSLGYPTDLVRIVTDLIMPDHQPIFRVDLDASAIRAEPLERG